jgi:hypothetical protein
MTTNMPKTAAGRGRSCRLPTPLLALALELELELELELSMPTSKCYCCTGKMGKGTNGRAPVNKSVNAKAKLR